MIRSFYTLSALMLAAATLSSCNNPTCGPGTVQKQNANGDLQCVPVDQPQPLTPCDVDGGLVEIVGGLCESHVKCDPTTTMYDPVTGVCVGTGSGTGACPPCPANPGSGMTCVTGGVVDFQTNMHLVSPTARPLRIAIYEPLAFLNNPATAMPLAETPSTDKGCFTLTVPTPSSGLVAIAVSDPQGAAPAMPLAVGGSGAPVVANKSYNIDAYMVLKSTLDGYVATSASYTANGAFVGCFYKDAPPSATNFLVTETMPASGVTLLVNGAQPSPVGYLKLDGSIDTALTTTGPRGCAVTPGFGTIGQISGSGGGVGKFQQAPGGSAATAVFISRFHDCDTTPSDPTCQ